VRIEVERADAADQGLDREEAHAGGGFAQVADAGELRAVFDGDAEPHVGRTPRWRVAGIEEVPQPGRALGEDLERAPVRALHRVAGAGDEIARDLFVEEG
jgi:hypothetical protein